MEKKKHMLHDPTDTDAKSQEGKTKEAIRKFKSIGKAKLSLQQVLN